MCTSMWCVWQGSNILSQTTEDHISASLSLFTQPLCGSGLCVVIKKHCVAMITGHMSVFNPLFFMHYFYTLIQILDLLSQTICLKVY